MQITIFARHRQINTPAYLLYLSNTGKLMPQCKREKVVLSAIAFERTIERRDYFIFPANIPE